MTAERIANTNNLESLARWLQEKATSPWNLKNIRSAVVRSIFRKANMRGHLFVVVVDYALMKACVSTYVNLRPTIKAGGVFTQFPLSHFLQSYVYGSQSPKPTDYAGSERRRNLLNENFVRKMPLKRAIIWWSTRFMA